MVFIVIVLDLSPNEYQPHAVVVILVFLMKYIWKLIQVFHLITDYTYKVNYDIYIVNYNILKSG